MKIDESKSPSMRAVMDAVLKVAATNATVLITGPTGTGKELLARMIHDQSARAAGPFVAVNCGAIASGVQESELFGHVRGAFTGACNNHPGVFRTADGGTIFLDEVGEIPLDFQPKFLRAIETHSVRSVGGKKERLVDVRIIAATNRDLFSLVTEGAFVAICSIASM